MPVIVVAPLWWVGSPYLPVTEETTVILSVAMLLALALPQHRAELPLSTLRKQLESEEPVEDAESVDDEPDPEDDPEWDEIEIG